MSTDKVRAFAVRWPLSGPPCRVLSSDAARCELALALLRRPLRVALVSLARRSTSLPVRAQHE